MISEIDKQVWAEVKKLLNAANKALIALKEENLSPTELYGILTFLRLRHIDAGKRMGRSDVELEEVETTGNSAGESLFNILKASDEIKEEIQS